MIRQCIALMLACCMLAACGENGRDPPRVNRTDLNGPLRGTLTRGSETHSFLALVRGSRLMAVDANAITYFDGPLLFNGNQVTSNALRVYAADAGGGDAMRAFSEVGSLAVTISPSYAWSGTLTTAAGIATLSLSYDEDAYAQDSSLSFTAGTWNLRGGSNTLTISDAGATSTSLGANCPATGSVTILDADHSIYGAQLGASAADCGTRAGVYTGFIVLGTRAAPLDVLALVVAKSDLFINALWDRQLPPAN